MKQKLQKYSDLQNYGQTGSGINEVSDIETKLEFRLGDYPLSSFISLAFIVKI